MLNSNGFRIASFGLAALSLGAAGWLALHRHWFEAVIMAGFVLVALLFGLWRERLPSLFTFLFTLAAAINALGYVLELWETPLWFDEVVHVFTPFALVAAIAWILLKRDDVNPSSNPVGYLLKIVAIGLAIGLAWEGFEWVIGIVGTWSDTVIDLAMDGIGSVVAALFCLWLARKEQAVLKR